LNEYLRETRDFVKMPSLFLISAEFELTSGLSNYVHTHQYDNGILICYNDFGEFMVDHLILDDAKVFHLVFWSTCR